MLAFWQSLTSLPHTKSTRSEGTFVRVVGRVAFVLLALILGVQPGITARAQGGGGLARLEPEQGVYFGVSLRWDQDSLAEFRSRLGQGPAP